MSKAVTRAICEQFNTLSIVFDINLLALKITARSQLAGLVPELL